MFTDRKSKVEKGDSPIEIYVGDYVLYDNKIWRVESEMSTNVCLRGIRSGDCVTPPYKDVEFYKKNIDFKLEDVPVEEKKEEKKEENNG